MPGASVGGRLQAEKASILLSSLSAPPSQKVDGPEGEQGPKKEGHEAIAKVGPGRQTRQRVGMGPPSPPQLPPGGHQMLLCNFRARPMAPPLWTCGRESAEIRAQKGGRAL
jgi:hypothetical protein